MGSNFPPFFTQTAPHSKQLTKTSRSKRHPVSGFINSCAVAHQFTISIKGLSQTAFSYVSVYRHNVLAAEYANNIIKVILKGFDHKTTEQHIYMAAKPSSLAATCLQDINTYTVRYIRSALRRSTVKHCTRNP